MRHGGPVAQLAWHAVAQPRQQQQAGEQQPGTSGGGDLRLLSLGGEGCLLSWPAIFPGAKVVQAQPLDVGAGLQQLLPPSAQPASAGGGGLAIERWCCVAVHSAGGVVAVGSASGQLLLLRPARASASRVPAARAGGGSSSDSWRRGPSPGPQAAAGAGAAPWQLLACVETPGQPLIAAAWQPAEAAAPDEAAAQVQQRVPAAEQLLAVISKHNVHLVACPAAASAAPPGPALSSCSVADAEQQQLLAVAWPDGRSVCVGCSDGSVQVLKLAGQESPQLQPLFGIRAQAGPVLCLAAVPGWPGLLLSGSQDQTLVALQPGHESARRTPASLVPLPCAATGSEQPLPAVEAADAAAALGGAAVAVGAASSLQQQPQPASGAPAAKRPPKHHFLPPRAQSFLPDLPDAGGAVGLQAQLDVVALAEALYPAPDAGRSACPLLDDGALRALLGDADGAAAAAAAASADEQQAACSFTEALQQQLAGDVGRAYVPGTWLPTLTADVPELLAQQRELRQQQAPGAAAGAPQQLPARQLGMLQLVAGDVAGFLQTAAAADAVLPDVVALSALGGVPAWRAAARLAAAKLVAVGDVRGAALHLAAAGDDVEAAELLPKT